MKHAGRSIQRTLLYVLFIAPTLIGTVFALSVVTIRHLSRDQSQFAHDMSLVQHTSELVTSLGPMQTMALNKDQMTGQLSAMYRRIDHSLSAIRRFLPDTDSPLFYFRTLSNMFDYYRQQSNALIDHRVPDDEVFQDRDFLNSLHAYMVRYAQRLAISVMATETRRQTGEIMAANHSTIVSFIIVFAVEVCGLAVIVLLIRRIYLTIHHLEEYAGGLARREWDLPDIEHYGYSDLRPVVTAFNEMKRSLVRHISQLEEKHRLEEEISRQSVVLLEQGKLLRESQLYALQSQINPHFLFNTLNVIARTALKERPEETVELIQATSEILRFSLKNLRRLVPLQDELESVEAYVLIQQRRFAGELDISMEVGNDVPRDILVPPLIIQPLIENSIRHGLDGKLFNRSVWGRVFRNGRRQVEITIEDNGVGIPADLLEKLNSLSNMSDPLIEAEKVGIRSVIRRIALAFGEHGHVCIDSEPGAFTRVTLTFPESSPEKREAGNV